VKKQSEHLKLYGAPSRRYREAAARGGFRRVSRRYHLNPGQRYAGSVALVLSDDYETVTIVQTSLCIGGVFVSAANCAWK
jgi:hypothetical protein